jgi:rhodanese-related sulfurtransferase
LDVRTAGEYQSGHFKNSLQADWLNKEQFTDRIKYLDKNKPLLVYCASGVRSGAAAKWLLENGFTDVQNLKGGWFHGSWKGNRLKQLIPKHS